MIDSVVLAARLFGRTLLAAAKSESSAATAAAAASAATTKVTNPLEQFFEVDRMPDDDKPVVYGSVYSCVVGEMTTVSTEVGVHNAVNAEADPEFLRDGSTLFCSTSAPFSLQGANCFKLTIFKEKNILMTQRQMLHPQNLRFPNPERISKVRKSMCRIKHVLTESERAIDEQDPRRSAEMKRMINAL